MALDLLSCIKGFDAIAEKKGFAGAARHLNISTPVLTKQIKHLENTVGRRLFDRTTRSVNLTEAGETYWHYAKNILQSVQCAADALHNLDREPHGHLTIGLPGVFNGTCFIRVFQTFLDKYRKITLQTTDENSPFCLLTHPIDLVVSEVNLTDKKFNKEFLFTIQRSVFAAPAYIEKHGVPQKIADLKKHNCLIFKRSHPNNEWLFANNKKVMVEGNYSSSSGRNIINAVKAGVGLLWCPTLVVREEVASGELVEVKLEKKPVDVKVFIYYRPVHYDSNIKLIVDHLKKDFPLQLQQKQQTGLNRGCYEK